MRPLATSTLVAGAQDLFTWDIEASANGSIAIKQFGFHINLNGVTLCSFRLWRNGWQEHLDAYHVISLTSNRGRDVDLKFGCITAEREISLSLLKTLQMKPDSRVTYTLRARASNVVQDAFVATRLFRTLKIMTSFISCAATPHVALSEDTATPFGVIWSDVSANPHNGDPCTSSRDWFGDALLRDLMTITVLQ